MALRLLNDGSRLVSCPESRYGARGVWVFPFHVQAYTEERPGRVQVLEVPGGVVGDTLGLTTPRFRLEMTFGNRPKTLGTARYSALELHEDLRRFVGYYFKERSRLLQARQPLIEMAYDDDYHKRSWIVIPEGLPTLRSSAQEPTRPRLALALTGDRPAQSAQPRPNALQNRLAPPSLVELGIQARRYCPVDGVLLERS